MASNIIIIPTRVYATGLPVNCLSMNRSYSLSYSRWTTVAPLIIFKQTSLVWFKTICLLRIFLVGYSGYLLGIDAIHLLLLKRIYTSKYRTSSMNTVLLSNGNRHPTLKRQHWVLIQSCQDHSGICMNFIGNNLSSFLNSLMRNKTVH